MAQAHRDFGEYDYIVVGAGSAGCVARQPALGRLRNRVLLLEAGGRDRWIWFHIPVGYLFAIGNPRADWMFTTGAGGRPRRALARLSARQGDRRLVGHQRHDLHARPGGRLRRLAPARACRLGLGRRAALFPAPRGPHGAAERAFTAPAASGGSSIRASAGTILDAVREAAAAAGIPAIDDFNTGDNEGSSYFQVNQKRGRRWSAARGFLKPVLERGPTSGSRPASQVERVVFEDGRATGVALPARRRARIARAPPAR